MTTLASIPAARATDPWTSHRAAQEHTQSGKRASHAALILEYVTAWPGHTPGEISVAMRNRGMADIDRVEVARRLNDLMRQGKVTKGMERRCGLTGKVVATWVVVEQQGALL